jgi:hypothetical protein
VSTKTPVIVKCRDDYFPTKDSTAMKPGLLVVAATASMLVFGGVNAHGASATKNGYARTGRSKLLATRAMLITRKKAVRVQLIQELPAYERRLHEQSTAFQMNKKLYARDLISKIELDNSERALKNVQLGAERIRELIATDDQALMLAGASAQGELQKVSNLRGYHETANLIRYNGAAHWSLAEAEKVAKFYRQQFGELLPVSARGQSRTHDRLGLDHRDALDVALQAG